jgi:hypothetical protein
MEELFLNCFVAGLFFSGEPAMGTANYTNPTGITPKYLLRSKVIVKLC